MQDAESIKGLGQVKSEVGSRKHGAVQQLHLLTTFSHCWMTARMQKATRAQCKDRDKVQSTSTFVRTHRIQCRTRDGKERGGGG